MAIRYIITPYDPKLWMIESIEKFGEPVSDLSIHRKSFLYQARKVWWYITDSLTLIVDDEPSLYCSFIQQQLLYIEIVNGKKFSEFIHWYRSYVPDNYELYLFREGDWDSLKLTKDMTAQDVSAWTGLP